MEFGSIQYKQETASRVLQSLERAAFESKVHTAYHGDMIKVEINHDRARKKQFIYSVLNGSGWDELTRSEFVAQIEKVLSPSVLESYRSVIIDQQPATTLHTS